MVGWGFLLPGTGSLGLVASLLVTIYGFAWQSSAIVEQRLQHGARVNVRHAIHASVPTRGSRPKGSSCTG